MFRRQDNRGHVLRPRFFIVLLSARDRRSVERKICKEETLSAFSTKQPRRCCPKTFDLTKTPAVPLGVVTGAPFTAVQWNSWKKNVGFYTKKEEFNVKELTCGCVFTGQIFGCCISRRHLQVCQERMGGEGFCIKKGRVECWRVNSWLCYYLSIFSRLHLETSFAGVSRENGREMMRVLWGVNCKI